MADADVTCVLLVAPWEALMVPGCQDELADIGELDLDHGDRLFEAELLNLPVARAHALMDVLSAAKVPFDLQMLGKSFLHRPGAKVERRIVAADDDGPAIPVYFLRQLLDTRGDGELRRALRAVCDQHPDHVEPLDVFARRWRVARVKAVVSEGVRASLAGDFVEPAAPGLSATDRSFPFQKQVALVRAAKIGCRKELVALSDALNRDAIRGRAGQDFSLAVGVIEHGLGPDWAASVMSLLDPEQEVA